MKRPCLEAGADLFGFSPEARKGELNSSQELVTKLAWLGDNWSYSSPEQAQRIIKECLVLMKEEFDKRTPIIPT